MYMCVRVVCVECVVCVAYVCCVCCVCVCVCVCNSAKEYYPALKGATDTCYDTDEPWKPYAKWNKADMEGQIYYSTIWDI